MTDREESRPPASTPFWERPPEPTTWQKVKKLLAPAGVILLLGVKFFGKLKFLLLPLLKYGSVLLKTGGTMVLTIWVYALSWGIWFAAGFVLLLFIHETGHLLAAKRLGLKVGAPVFIPFMGAFIALKEAPRNAWVESQVGIGGPLLGTVGAAACQAIHAVTGKPIFGALAYTGYFLNLFNLAPIGFLDGGRIVTALSPWLWLVGLVILVGLTLSQPNFLLILILILSVPRLFFLFRRKSAEELRYFEVTPGQRWAMGAMYFALVAFLVMGMRLSHVQPPSMGGN
jgi:Zn-dependent protease